jgi:hypothetical protein
MWDPAVVMQVASLPCLSRSLDYGNVGEHEVAYVVGIRALSTIVCGVDEAVLQTREKRLRNTTTSLNIVWDNATTYHLNIVHSFSKVLKYKKNVQMPTPSLCNTIQDRPVVEFIIMNRLVHAMPRGGIYCTFVSPSFNPRTNCLPIMRFSSFA